jgi:flagellar biosynthetic protein FliR
VIALAPQTILWVFLYFCRIGAMLMTFPGYASGRIPVRVRLFVALGVTFALAPILMTIPGAVPAAKEPAPAILLGLAASELLKGLAIGLMARMFFLAFEFLATALTQFAGLGNFPGVPAEGREPVPALVSLIMLTATVLIFASGLHVQALAAVVDSYAVSPIGAAVSARGLLDDLAGKLSAATFLSLQAISPFAVYAVVVNLAIGLINRMTPQIPAYFISLPLVLIGGLFLLFFVMDRMFLVFVSGFADWLING